MVRLLFKIVLKEDSEVLDEVVVVGYGTQKEGKFDGEPLLWLMAMCWRIGR